MSEQEIIRLIFMLVRSAIDKNSPIDADYAEVDWEQIYETADKNLLVPLLCSTILKLSKICLIPEEMIARWKKATMLGILYECDKSKAFRQLLMKAEEVGISPVMIKGCVLAELYPNYASRSCSDSDILIKYQEQEAMVKLLLELGYNKDELSSKEKVSVYMNDKLHHKVELHLSLWEDYQGAKINLLEDLHLTEEKTLINMKACDWNVTTLGYEEHLIYQMFHIIKHFSLQGIVARYLVDITLYINRYEGRIDFTCFWQKMDNVGYSEFCESFFEICVEYLGMSGEIMKGRKRKKARKIQEFLIDLMNGGSMYNDKNSGWQLLEFIEPYFVGEQRIPRSRLVRRIRLLISSSCDLSNSSRYVQKHHLLHPFAWISRSFYLFTSCLKHSYRRDAQEKLSITEHRLYLMRSLGLVDGGRK